MALTGELLLDAVNFTIESKQRAGVHNCRTYTDGGETRNESATLVESRCF